MKRSTATHHAAVEMLEARRHLTAAIWTDGGGDERWSNSANWQGDVIPAVGQDVQIDRTTGSGFERVDVDVPVTVGTMSMDYTLLSGSPITVDGDIGGGTFYILDPITLGRDITITGGPTLGGSIDDGGNQYGITIANAHLVMTPIGFDAAGLPTISTASLASTYTGETIVEQGSTLFTNVDLASPINVSGGSRLTAGGEIKRLDNIESNSTCSIDIEYFDSVPQRLIVQDGVTFSDGTLVNFVVSGDSVGDGITSAGTSSQIEVQQGAIHLNNATLSCQIDDHYKPVAGDVITLIKNDTGSPVVGTFHALPDGAMTSFGRHEFAIHYHGGLTGQSVTLTPVFTAPIVASITRKLVTSSVRATLNVLGAEASATPESDLSYKWVVVRAPRGAKRVVFSDNDDNTAKSASARFKKAGTYILNSVITDSAGNSVTTPVTIKIKQVASSLLLSPHAAQLQKGSKTSYAGVAMDQFKHAMRIAAEAVFALLAGDGTIDGSGVFTAGQRKDHVVVQITIGDLVGTVGATTV